MASLYITEYSGSGFGLGPVPVAATPANASQVVGITGSSAQSTALKNNTSLVRVHADAICAVDFGTNPIATIPSGGLGSARMAANQTEYFAVKPGTKIAVISST